jgi:hypothetical protein
LNGLLENTEISNPYQGTTGYIFIGAINNILRSYFTGYIDQVSLMTRTKTAAEILIDATLVCFYSFDSSLYYDSGPLSLSASGLSISSSTGRVNTAISFTAASSYFVVGGLTKLGTIGQVYSISIWIKPTSVSGGTIIHVSKCSSSCGSNWCLAFIGFTSSGEIAIQSWTGVYNSSLVALTGPVLSINVWTHIVQTYSSSNGMRLFLNGTLFSQSATFVYSASDMPDFIYLGSYPLPVCVGTNVISMGQYYGLLDEFRLFARDLTPAEVYELANP